MIEQLGKVFRAMRKVDETEQQGDLQRMITESGRELLGFEPTLLLTMDEAALLNFFRPGKELDAGKCLAAAVLLSQKARSMRVSDPQAAQAIRKNALYLLLLALVESPAMRETEFAALLPELLSEVPEAHRSPAVQRLLLAFWKDSRDFGRFEDLLFRLVAAGRIDHAEAVGMLRSLLKLPDEVLQKGNLPREEVLEAIEELTQRKMT
jgi:hypothetical protein